MPEEPRSFHTFGHVQNARVLQVPWHKLPPGKIPRYCLEIELPAPPEQVPTPTVVHSYEFEKGQLLDLIKLIVRETEGIDLP